MARQSKVDSSPHSGECSYETNGPIGLSLTYATSLRSLPGNHQANIRST